MIIKEKIATLIEGYLADNSLFLVDITISSENDIEIAIDSYDRVDIKNCADISRIKQRGGGLLSYGNICRAGPAI